MVLATLYIWYYILIVIPIGGNYIDCLLPTAYLILRLHLRPPAPLVRKGRGGGHMPVGLGVGGTACRQGLGKTRGNGNGWVEMYTVS